MFQDDNNNAASAVERAREAMDQLNLNTFKEKPDTTKVVLDVVPTDDDSLDVMAKVIMAIEKQGLKWEGVKLVPTMYGHHKLQVCLKKLKISVFIIIFCVVYVQS